MPAFPIAVTFTTAEFSGESADDYPDGQRVNITDDNNAEWEARGADGARVWVQIHNGTSAAGTRATGEAIVNDGVSAPPTRVWSDTGTDFIYEDLP